VGSGAASEAALERLVATDGIDLRPRPSSSDVVFLVLALSISLDSPLLAQINAGLSGLSLKRTFWLSLSEHKAKHIYCRAQSTGKKKPPLQQALTYRISLNVASH